MWTNHPQAAAIADAKATAAARIRALSFVVNDDGILGFALNADADGVTVMHSGDFDDNVFESYGYDYDCLTPLDAYSAGEFEIDADYVARLLRAAAAAVESSK